MNTTMTKINQSKLTKDLTSLEDGTSVQDTFRLANARNKALRGQRSRSNTWSWLVLGSSCAALAIIMLTPLSMETSPYVDTTLAINGLNSLPPPIKTKVSLFIIGSTYTMLTNNRLLTKKAPNRGLFCY